MKYAIAIAVAASLFAAAVYAQTGIFGVSKTTEVLVLNSAATKLPSNTGAKGRWAIDIQNLGPNQIFCAFSAAAAVVNKARMIPVDGNWTLEAPSNTDIWCIAATADQATGNATIVSEVIP